MKNQPVQKKTLGNHEKILRMAHKNYIIGNFYQTRRLVNELLFDTAVTSEERSQCLLLRRLTSMDKLAFGVGFLCVILTFSVAMIVRY